jgi:catechol 2,3-dioxygenase-like lactoylglutathione lyase family enzyme
MVRDVEAAAAFYTRLLGFGMERRPAPGFAVLSRGPLRLLLSTPGGPGGAGRPMPDGRKPEPGGWNRIQLTVEDLAREVETLKRAGARFRNDVVAGFGGKQVLIEDPSGNPIELFEPRRDDDGSSRGPGRGREPLRRLAASAAPTFDGKKRRARGDSRR